MANELRHRGKNHPETDNDNAESRSKRPFDTSGMNWVPEFEEDDPPYRDWWVIESRRDDE